MLHRLAELDALVRQGYADFDYKRIVAQLNAFLTSTCPHSTSTSARTRSTAIRSPRRRARPASPCSITCSAARSPGSRRSCASRRRRRGSRRYGGNASVHLELFPTIPDAWRNDALAEKWRKVRSVRRVVTGALEIERAGKRIGSSLEAAPVIHVSDPELFAALLDIDLAEVCITSAATLVEGDGPADAFRLDEVRGVAVVPRLATGRKCARSWKISPEVGSRSRLSRRHAARCAGPAGMGSPAQGGRVTSRAFESGSRCLRRMRSYLCPAPASYVWGSAVGWPGSGDGYRAARPGLEAVGALRLRPQGTRGRPPRALPGFRADLEQGHQLWPVPAGWAARAMGAARASRPRRWCCCGCGSPAPARS